MASLDSAEYELWMIWFLYFPKSFDAFLVAQQVLWLLVFGETLEGFGSVCEQHVLEIG